MAAESLTLDVPGLTDRIAGFLSQFVEAAIREFGADLRSVVLYGSAAEGKLTPTSDINVLVVAKEFPRAAIDGLRETYRTAEAAVNLKVMFVLESELSFAAEAFAQKFADILRRHRVLHGSDPVASLVISRPAEIFRVKQMLLNLRLRLRESYVSRSLRAEQCARILADTYGPLSTAAATLLELEGGARIPPAAALEQVLRSQARDWRPFLNQILAIREGGQLSADDAARALYQAVELSALLGDRAAALRQ
jgi:predicted nucleotidyltransferase